MRKSANNPFIPDEAEKPMVPMPGQASAPSNESFEIDLTDTADSQYCIPDGNYKAKCIDVQQNVSKSGNPMFVWEFELVEGKYKGRTFKSWTAITPAAMWKIAETVVALGVGQSGQVVKFNRSDVIGKLCGLIIEEDEYNGKKSSKIRSVISVDDIE